jgi:hypothetical protein
MQFQQSEKALYVTITSVQSSLILRQVMRQATLEQA